MEQLIQVDEIPNANFSAPSVCTYSTILFNDLSSVQGSAITNWLWNFGDSNTSTLQNPNHNYSNQSVINYNVTLIVTSAAGCKDTLVKPVNLFSVPVASFTTTNECLNRISWFTNQSSIGAGNISNALWQFGDGTQLSNSGSATHVYQNAGIYNVQLVVTSDHGCKDSVQTTTQIYHLPDVHFSAIPLTGCEPLEVIFSNQSTCIDGSITKWQWFFGDGKNDSVSTAIHIYNDAGIYTVQLNAVSSFGCESKEVKNNYIKVNHTPVADFKFDPEKPSIFFPIIQFADLSIYGDNWYYDFGDGGISSQQNPMHTYKDWGSYLIEQIVTNQYGCADTAYRRIEIDSAFTVYIPNAFSPNADGHNETFMCSGIGIKSLSMIIYNRWGELIYTANSINEPWDGTHDGNFVQSGVYAYVFNVTDIFNNPHVIRGVVRLVR